MTEFFSDLFLLSPGFDEELKLDQPVVQRQERCFIIPADWDKTKCIVCIQMRENIKPSKGIRKAVYSFHDFRPTHCEKHRLLNQIHRRDPICQTQDCIKIAYYGKIGERPSRATSCRIHKLPEDVYLRIDKLCHHSGCYNLKNYGPANGKRRHCSIHAVEGEICFSLGKKIH